jgi:hypothetical protein
MAHGLTLDRRRPRLHHRARLRCNACPVQRRLPAAALYASYIHQHRLSLGSRFAGCRGVPENHSPAVLHREIEFHAAPTSNAPSSASPRVDNVGTLGGTPLAVNTSRLSKYPVSEKAPNDRPITNSSKTTPSGVPVIGPLPINVRFTYPVADSAVKSKSAIAAALAVIGTISHPRALNLD